MDFSSNSVPFRAGSTLLKEMWCKQNLLSSSAYLTYPRSYFTKESQHGVCVFLRRKTGEQGHRGFRLSSLGILLAKSDRPRPWRHVNALKQLINSVYDRSSNRRTREGNSEGVNRPSLELAISEDDWEPAREFFEERKLKRADLGGAGHWTGWSDELDGVCLEALFGRHG